MTTYYIDYTKGNTGNDGLGWRKVSYTSGGVAAVVAGDVLTGAVSGATVTVQRVTLTGGSWAAGTADGVFYVMDNQTGNFAAENLNVVGKQDNIATIAADTAICSKAITDNLSTANLAPGDLIKVAKSPAPVSLGAGITSTWTKDSGTVTLNSAVTLNIDACENIYTSAQGANVTPTVSALAFEGAGSCQLAIAAGAANGLLAYNDSLGVQTDFSAYQQVSFWFFSSVILAAGDMQILLCSDAAGAVPVETINVPATAANQYVPVVYDKGAALANNIRSVGINMVVDKTATIRVDNIFASKAASSSDSLTLNSVISTTSSDVFSLDDGWYAIKSINGTNIVLATGATGAVAATLLYPLTTKNNVACYKRDSIAITASQDINESGSLAAPSSWTGGYNPTTDTIDGMTFFRRNLWTASVGGFNLAGTMNYLNISNFGFVRTMTTFNSIGVNCQISNIYTCAATSTSSFSTRCYFKNIILTGSYVISACVWMPSNGSIFDNFHIWGSDIYSAGYSVIQTATNGTFLNCSVVNITSPSAAAYAFTGLYNSKLVNCNFRAMGNGLVYGGVGYSGGTYLYNCVIEGTEFPSPGPTSVFSQAHDASPNNCLVVNSNGTVITSADGLGGIKWVFSPTIAVGPAIDSGVNIDALNMQIATVFVKSGSSYTVNAVVNRSNVAIYGTLLARGGQVAGVTADQYETTHEAAASDETLSITLNPTADGVVSIELYVYGGTIHTLDLSDVTVNTSFDSSGLSDVDMSNDGQPFVTNIATGGGGVPVSLKNYIMRIVGSNEG